MSLGFTVCVRMIVRACVVVFVVLSLVSGVSGFNFCAFQEQLVTLA